MAEDAFPISGTIDPKAFPFLLMDLHRNGATGSLKVDGPAYQKALYFRGGRILFGSSNDPKDQLGSILIESGRISPEQLEDVNTKVGPGSPLAKVLAESGFVSQRELSEAARAKVERILSDVLSYDGGSFEFEDGVLPKGAVDLKLSPDKLVLAAVRRIGDRAFVLRHLDGLDAVLARTGDGGTGQRLADLQAETGHLADQLDGRRTLKDAAAAARLDEFEAAKVACGLLFLGLVERTGSASPAPPQESGFAIVEGEDLDLGTTARMAFAPGATETSATAEIEPERDPLAFASPQEPAEPDAVTMASPRRFQPETIYIEPSAPGAPPPVVPRAEEPPPVAPRRPTPTDTKPPVRRGAAEIRLPSMADASFEAAGDSAPAKPNPPSREDLAALDALLNSRGLEGPMTPLEKPKDDRWEPRFGQPAVRPQPRGGGRGRGVALLVAALLAVAAVGGAVWFKFLRNPPAPGVAVVEATMPTPPPPTTVTPESETTTTTMPPEATPTTTLAPATPPPTTLPSPTPRLPSPTVPTSPPPRRSGTGSLVEARAALEKGRFSQAAGEFASSLRGVTRGSFTVQLLVACADETVAKASQNVSAQEFFIVPVEYKGRSCYRICWGVYDSETRARAAFPTIPEYFRKGGASPKAVPTASILP